MASSSWDRSGQAGDVLHALVRDFGPEVLSNAQLLKNLLGDKMPAAPREASVLVAAAEAGVAGVLRERLEHNMPPEAAIQQASITVEERRGYDRAASRWAVVEFARALGYEVDHAAPPPPETPAEQAVTVAPPPTPPPTPPPAPPPVAAPTPAPAGRRTTAVATAAVVAAVVVLGVVRIITFTRGRGPSHRSTSQRTTVPQPSTTARGPLAGPGRPSPVPLTDPNGPLDVAKLIYPTVAANRCYHPENFNPGASCPMTPRLLQALAKAPQDADPVCRCQNDYASTTSKVTSTPDANKTVVTVTEHFGGQDQAIDVTVLRTTDGWFADDLACAGDSQSTVYNGSPGPC